MKIKIWTRICDSGDGSSSVELFSTEKKAREGLDEDGYEDGWEYPYDVDSVLFNIDNCEKFD